MDRLLHWVGYAVVLVAALGMLAMIAEAALDRVVKACGVYKLVLEFLWDREKYRRLADELERAQKGGG